MPFTNLTLAAGRTNHSEGTGVPDDGINEFLHGWNLDPDVIDENLIDIQYLIPPGSSVTAATAATPALSADRLSLRINFTQAGGDAITVIAKHVWSGSA